FYVFADVEIEVYMHRGKAVHRYFPHRIFCLPQEVSPHEPSVRGSDGAFQSSDESPPGPPHLRCSIHDKKAPPAWLPVLPEPPPWRGLSSLLSSGNPPGSPVSVRDRPQSQPDIAYPSFRTASDGSAPRPPQEFWRTPGSPPPADPAGE